MIFIKLIIDVLLSGVNCLGLLFIVRDVCSYCGIIGIKVIFVRVLVLFVRGVHLFMLVVIVLLIIVSIVLILFANMFTTTSSINSISITISYTPIETSSSTHPIPSPYPQSSNHFIFPHHLTSSTTSLFSNSTL